MEKNQLLLTKCAYIFDSSDSGLIYGSKQNRERVNIVRKYLKKAYHNEDVRLTPIDYIVKDNSRPAILIDGYYYTIENDLSIASIKGQLENTLHVNDRKYFDVNQVLERVNPKHFHIFCNDSICSNKFKSLYFEFFNDSVDHLGYIRVHFNNSYCSFFITRENKLYEDRSNNKEITTKDIINYLCIKSNNAIKEFMEVMNAINEIN